jgi:hypothetical protein
MKITSKSITELLFTIFVAWALSALLAGILMFTFANLNVLDKAQPWIDAATYILFGLIIGYKFNSIFATTTATKKKKK